MIYIVQYTPCFIKAEETITTTNIRWNYKFI